MVVVPQSTSTSRETQQPPPGTRRGLSGGAGIRTPVLVQIPLGIYVCSRMRSSGRPAGNDRLAPSRPLHHFIYVEERHAPRAGPHWVRSAVVAES